MAEPKGRIIMDALAGPLTERGNKHKEYERDYPDDGRNYRAPAKAQLIDDWPGATSLATMPTPLYTAKTGA